MVTQRDSLGRRIFRDTASTSVINIVGQGLAFLTAAYVAAVFGADSRTDALYLALAIPMFFSTVIREAVRSSLVPRLVELRLKASPALGAIASGSVLTVGALSAGLALVLAVATPTLTRLMGAYLPPTGQALLPPLTLALLPLLPLLTMNGALGAVFSTWQRFRPSAALTTVESIVRIVIVMAFAGTLGIFSLAFGYVAGALAGVIFLAVVAWRLGLLSDPRPQPPGVLLSGFTNQALYQLAGLTMLQLNPYIDRFMATPLSPGSLTALNYAERISALPYTLVGAVFYEVLLSHWSMVTASEGADGLRRALRNAAAMIIFFLTPIVVVMFVLRLNIVTLLLQRGAFDASDAALTASALGFLSLGVISNYMTLLVTRAFLALQDMMTPMWLGALNAVLNLSLNLLLIGPLGLGGIALSTALTWTVVAIVGWIVVRRRLGSLDSRSLLRPALSVALAAVACGATTALARPLIPQSGFIAQAIGIAIAAGLGLAVYLLVTWLLRVEELSKVRVLLRRRGP